jgi:hypothetical protein
MNGTSTLRSMFVVALAAGLTLLGFDASASANLTKNKRFVFRGTIHPEGDPVNILFHGGDETEGGSCHGDGTRSPLCVLQHVKLDWGNGGTETDRGNMRERTCNGTANKAHLKMLAESGGFVDPGAIWHTSTSRSCRTQYHLRNWNDAAHGHGTDHQWQVQAIHHERRRNRKHIIDHHWETDEGIMVIEMGVGDNRHCTHPDYYRLPGSAGTFQGKKSNGKISRISFQKTDHVNKCSGS